MERIEILKDGASAVYGSDAIAGVVNIILKKSFKGARIGGDIGTSWKGDGTTKHGFMTLGVGDLAADGHNFYVAAEMRNQNQIRYSDRGGYFTKTNYTDQGGVDTTLGVPTDANLGLARSGTGYVYNGLDIAGFMPGCDRTSYDAGQCTYTNTWSQIQPNTSNANFITRFTLRDAANWQANLDASYFVSKSQQLGAPSRARGTFQGFTSGPGITPTQLPVVHPIIDITNPSFPTDTGGVTSGRLAYTFLDLGPTTTDTDARTLRTVANIDGHVADWDINASFGYSQVALDVEGHNYVDPYAFAAALASPTDPYLVGQPNSQSVIDRIAPLLVSHDLSKLYFAHFEVSHDLMQLNGGPLGFAMGADLMHRSQYAVAPDQVNAGHYFGLYSNNFTIGYQNVASLNAELSIPVTKTLEVDPQVRFDHYNLSGSRTSPKVGVKWAPSKSFALRGTASTGFRAPSPSENGTAGQVFFTGNTDDPVLCPNGPDVNGYPNVPGNFPTQCGVPVGTVQTTTKTLKPETSKSFTLGLIAEPVRGFSTTVDYYWIQINKQIIPSSDVQTVRGTDFTPIPFVNPDGSISERVPTVAPISYFTTGYVNANSTTTSGIDVDVAWQQRMGAYGDFKSDFQISYMFKYDLKADGTTYHLAGTHGPSIIGGDTGSPKMRMRWANTWQRGPVALTGTINYIGGYSNNDPSDQAYAGPSCADQERNNGVGGVYFPNLDDDALTQKLGCRTKSFTTFDLNAEWTVTKGFSVNGSILNVFNQKAPLDWATYGGGAAPYNPSLHSQGAIGRYFTVGAAYQF